MILIYLKIKALNKYCSTNDQLYGYVTIYKRYLFLRRGLRRNLINILVNIVFFVLISIKILKPDLLTKE